VRFRNGRWNFSDFLVRKPGKKPGPPFTGKVFIHDGQIYLRDYQVKIQGAKVADNQVSGLEGLFDAASAPYYRFEAAGIGTKGRVGQVAASGTMHTKKGVFQIDLTALDAAASYWPNYFAGNVPVKLTHGMADVSISVSREGVGKRANWDYAGSAELRNIRHLSSSSIKLPVQ
jgi:hypothetical protein